MSLVVARKDGTNIYVVSDTKLSFPDSRYPEKKIAAPSDGIIKTLFIIPQICVSFAGEKELAEAAIRECRKLEYQYKEILQYLLTINQSTKNKVEFIVCVSRPVNKIFEVKNSLVIEDVPVSWIGDSNAYNEFQKHSFELKSQQTKEDIQGNLESSMNQVIQSNVSSVGGFLISVEDINGFFYYKGYIQTYMPPRTYMGAGTHVLNVYGTAQKGGYTVHIFQASLQNVLPIHIPQGRFGIIYTLTNKGILEPTVYNDMDEHEFSDIVYERYNLKNGYTISSLQKSYFERGNKSYEKKDFTKAIFFL